MTSRFSMRDLTKHYATSIYYQSMTSIINAPLDYCIAHGMTERQAWQEACPELYNQ